MMQSYFSNNFYIAKQKTHTRILYVLLKAFSELKYPAVSLTAA